MADREKKMEGQKYNKFDYLKNEKSFFAEIKSTLHSFWRAIIWWKNKKLIKIADTSFNEAFSYWFFKIILFIILLKNLLKWLGIPFDYILYYLVFHLWRWWHRLYDLYHCMICLCFQYGVLSKVFELLHSASLYWDCPAFH